MNIKKSDFKKSSEEMQEFLKFRNRGFSISSKKGKGSYKRKEKHQHAEY